MDRFSQLIEHEATSTDDCWICACTYTPSWTALAYIINNHRQLLLNRVTDTLFRAVFGDMTDDNRCAKWNAAMWGGFPNVIHELTAIIYLRSPQLSAARFRLINFPTCVTNARLRMQQRSMDDTMKLCKQFPNQQPLQRGVNSPVPYCRLQITLKIIRSIRPSCTCSWATLAVYGHFGPKTLRTQDISALVPKCPLDILEPP